MNPVTRHQALKIVALIPAYNEAANIDAVLEETMGYVDEIIVCDDGSEDDTAKIAGSHGVKLIKHRENRGYGAALKTLFNAALSSGADIAVTLDADGQHDPRDIARLVNELAQQGCDISIGSRVIDEESQEIPRWRVGGVKLINRFMDNGGKLGVTDSQSGFRAYSRRALETLTVTEDGMGASKEILLKARENDLKICEVPIKIHYHEDSSTSTPLVHVISVVLSTVRHLSINKPLTFYGIPGITSMLISLFFWTWAFSIFSQTRGIITSIALIALGTTMVGLLLMTTAIVLWVLMGLFRENSQ